MRCGRPDCAACVSLLTRRLPTLQGAFDSDTTQGSINMREAIMPVLDEYGADLVISAHSQSYERSYLINGHYGTASSFSEGSHKTSSSTGDPYPKPPGLSSRRGLVCVVAGA